MTEKRLTEKEFQAEYRRLVKSQQELLFSLPDGRLTYELIKQIHPGDNEMERLDRVAGILRRVHGA